MASGPITPWQIDGETMKTVTGFIWGGAGVGGSKITVDGDCIHEIKRWLIPGRKAMTNLESILKSRDITLPTKIRPVKAMVFPVVIYGCGSWTIKRAECRRIDAFELWCWRRPLRITWTARRSKQPILKEISPEYSLEVLMMKLKLQYSARDWATELNWAVKFGRKGAIFLLLRVLGHLLKLVPRPGKHFPLFLFVVVLST